MVRQFSSVAAEATLSGNITDVATTMGVSTTAGWPLTTPFTLAIDPDNGSKELVEVTHVAGTTLTVTRGIDGTSAVSHTLGAEVEHVHSARDFREPLEHIAATSNVHGVTGALVGASEAVALTNKDLTSGTNTFPASLVRLTTSQTLTNKDLSDPSNIFPSSLATDAELSAAIAALSAATTGVHGVGSGAVMGTTLTQTVTNKNFTSGTNTFPSSLATLTGAQAFTNKDLTSGTNTFPASLATLTGTQTLTNKTINDPVLQLRSTKDAAETAGTLSYDPSTKLMYAKIGAPATATWASVQFDAGAEVFSANSSGVSVTTSPTDITGDMTVTARPYKRIAHITGQLLMSAATTGNHMDWSIYKDNAIVKTARHEEAGVSMPLAVTVSINAGDAPVFKLRGFTDTGTATIPSNSAFTYIEAFVVPAITP